MKKANKIITPLFLLLGLLIVFVLLLYYKHQKITFDKQPKPEVQLEDIDTTTGGEQTTQLRKIDLTDGPQIVHVEPVYLNGIPKDTILIYIENLKPDTLRIVDIKVPYNKANVNNTRKKYCDKTLLEGKVAVVLKEDRSPYQTYYRKNLCECLSDDTSIYDCPSKESSLSQLSPPQ